MEGSEWRSHAELLNSLSSVGRGAHNYTLTNFSVMLISTHSFHLTTTRSKRGRNTIKEATMKVRFAHLLLTLLVSMHLSSGFAKGKASKGSKSSVDVSGAPSDISTASPTYEVEASDYPSSGVPTSIPTVGSKGSKSSKSSKSGTGGSKSSKSGDEDDAKTDQEYDSVEQLALVGSSATTTGILASTIGPLIAFAFI